MENHKQPLSVPVDCTQAPAETPDSLTEVWNTLQALPSYIEENAEAVRQERLEEFADWFLSAHLSGLL